MNLRDLFFRRRPPIADLGSLADFIDEQSAFLTQKGIYEYSRARPATTPRSCSATEFIDACRPVRAGSAYPLGLAMVGELAEGVLRGLGPSANPKEVSLSGCAYARSIGVRQPSCSPARSARRRGEMPAQNLRVAPAACRPASAQAGHGHSRAAGEDLFRSDAHSREAARPRLLRRRTIISRSPCATSTRS